ncbi:hypothetical protein SISSUDRAFT_458614 [Sistotremastrum suecicum HHB10207 ss-3]|uniref:Uncharacterized protein n=1 Tax=Sistotremastrum suecicum HHB10207 ss-3 TaxID=1314776 RepID=A0A165Y6W6_9AGAM|nr:hypothetical protein SISSUDRAFT_458614 [Sistotremastrum suecicum HHB10207 ss-3]
MPWSRRYRFLNLGSKFSTRLFTKALLTGTGPSARYQSAAIGHQILQQTRHSFLYSEAHSDPAFCPAYISVVISSLLGAALTRDFSVLAGLLLPTLNLPAPELCDQEATVAHHQ